MSGNAFIEGILARHFPDESWVDRPEALAGGSINEVWRMRSRRRSVVLKRAPAHASANPTVQLSPERLTFEARALLVLAPGGELEELASEALRPPRLLKYESASFLLMLEDLGDGADLAASPELPVQAAEWGGRLGAFIGKLHARTFGDHCLREGFRNESVQRTRLTVQYVGAAEFAKSAINRSASPAPESAYLESMRANAESLGRHLLEPGRCLTMGDLWPRSILVRPAGLRLIDWEFAHFGHPLQDCAHFAAHCWMHSRTSGPKVTAEAFTRLWRAFAAEYTEAVRAVPGLWREGDARWMNIHVGAEILARIAGPFRCSGPFASVDPDSAVHSGALEMCLALLSQPEETLFPPFSDFLR